MDDGRDDDFLFRFKSKLSLAKVTIIVVNLE